MRNVRAHPDVTVRVGGESFAARARVLDSSKNSADSDADLRGTIQELSRAKYGWGEGTVVELIPEPPGKSQG